MFVPNICQNTIAQLKYYLSMLSLYEKHMDDVKEVMCGHF